MRVLLVLLTRTVTASRYIARLCLSVDRGLSFHLRR